MYSYEINDIMKCYNYRIPSYMYIKICKNSPQIRYIERKGDNNYYMSTNDGYEWYFNIYYYSETF